MTAEQFRINMASGKPYDIRHPEMVAVGPTTIHVFAWMIEDEEQSKEREQELSIIPIEFFEPLKTANAQDQSQN